MQWLAGRAVFPKFGFKPMTTAMAIFADPAQALQRGLIREA